MLQNANEDPFLGNSHALGECLGFSQALGRKSGGNFEKTKMTGDDISVDESREVGTRSTTGATMIEGKPDFLPKTVSQHRVSDSFLEIVAPNEEDPTTKRDLDDSYSALKERDMALHKNRWMYVACGTLIMCCVGNVYAWSSFSKPLEKEGVSKKDSTLAFQLAILIFALAMLKAGRVQDRTGPRNIAMFGGALLGIGFCLLKWMESSTGLMILFFSGIAGIGMGCLYVAPLGCALQWFPDKRGLISGVVVTGMGLGSLFGGVVGPLLMEEEGMKVYDVFLLYGAVFGVLTVACASYLAKPPPNYKPPKFYQEELLNQGTAATQQEAAKKEAAREDYEPYEMLFEPSFWGCWLVFLIGTVSGLLVISKASVYGQDVVGLSAAAAGSMITVMGVCNAAGRVLFGFMSDKIGRKAVIHVALILQILVMGPLMTQTTDQASKSQEALFGFGIAMLGLTYGGFLGTMPAIIADFYGSKNVGFNYALCYTAWGVAGVLGPQIAVGLQADAGSSANLAIALDARDKWNKAFWLCAAVNAVGLVVWFLTKPPSGSEKPNSESTPLRRVVKKVLKSL